MISNPKHIIIARTDSIGDVMLTLPVCGILKSLFPGIKITFIGKNYTKDIIQSCIHVDDYMSWDELQQHSEKDQIAQLIALQADSIIHVFPEKELLKLAFKARIKNRIATGRRWWTVFNCNYPVFFSRKKSELHEAQLNCKLLEPFGYRQIPSLIELADFAGFRAEKVKLPFELSNRKKIILHPLSKGSAVNWSLKKFEELSQILFENGFEVFVTGTKPEGDKIKKNSELLSNSVTDLTGKLSLKELIYFISQCDGLVAASTGPLHIAAELGINAFGLYTPKRPMHAGRWSPIGSKTKVFIADEHPENGDLEISANAVAELIFSSVSK
ncbi:MAG: glycosyltransferase family 9 protein [Flavobacteriales bacterium]